MTDTIIREQEPARSAPVPEPPAPVPVGDPGLLGLPLIIAGALGLGLSNIGVLDSGATVVPILLSATVIGLLITTVWSAALGQNVNVTVYGVFLGFYGSYATLSIGLTHNWFGIPPEAATQATVLWLVSWLVTIGILTVLSVRLPWTYPVLFAIVDVALVLLLIGTLAASPIATKAGGLAIFAFVAFVVYFYAASLWEETGGRVLPLGRPLIS